MDPFELLEPVDIIPKLPADLDTNLASKKWQERKTTLDAVHEILLKNPKLVDNPDCGDLIDKLTKHASDSDPEVRDASCAALGAIQKCIGESALAVFLGAEIVKDSTKMSKIAEYREKAVVEAESQKVLKSDANINCAAVAAKCLTGMAKGLRNKFGPHTASLSPIIFDKFKEKKPHLRDPLIELIDAVFATTTLNNLSASILEAAKKPNPSQKSQLDHFIYRTFRSLNSKDIPKGLLKDLVASLTNHASDSDPEVRDASCAALGAIQKCIGESALAVFLGAEIVKDSTKMSKIAEYREKAISEGPSTKIESVKSVVAAPPPPNVKKADENKAKVQNNTTKPTTAAASNNKPESVPDSVENSEDDASTQVQQPNQKKAVKNSKQQQKPEQPKVEPKVEVLEPEFLLLFKSDRALRLKEEKALKTLKWNFDTPTAEHLEQLTNSLTSVTKPPLTGQLFNKDFKQQIKAIEYLNEVCVKFLFFQASLFIRYPQC
ncbi:unnamed protein product [Meloidogyne enterolobii]|uniref:Uncharacterized protein n=1 Tax=Meloidogyne enterolobii TaxID=390850 RepID=A0ACB1ATU7_MELEN